MSMASPSSKRNTTRQLPEARTRPDTDTTGSCAVSAVMYDRPMSEAIAFDTHRFVKRLTESGFTEKQAETLAEEHVDLLNANLATKADVEVARADIARVEAGIETLRQETKAAIETVKVDLLKWLFGALIAQGGLIVALVKLLP